MQFHVLNCLQVFASYYCFFTVLAKMRYAMAKKTSPCQRIENFRFLLQKANSRQLSHSVWKFVQGSDPRHWARKKSRKTIRM